MRNGNNKQLVNNMLRLNRLFWGVLVACTLVAVRSTGSAVGDNNDPQNIVVTGTLPFLKRRESSPFAPDRVDQAPYVHWTCYHGDELQSNSIELHCCRIIYHFIQTDPVKFRWRSKKDVVGDNKFDKRDFMRYCKTNLQKIPAGTNQKPSIGPISPRYTLFRVPEGAPPLKINTWTQAFGASTPARAESNAPAVQHSSGDVSSPLTLSSKFRELFEEPTDEDESGAISFGAELESTFAADEDNDLERYLKHTLTISLPSELEVESTSKLELQILLFFPSGVALGKKSRSLQSCRQDGKKQETCEVRSNSHLPTKTSLTQLEVVDLRLSTSIPAGSSGQIKLEWMTQMVLEDDEKFMLPAPVIYTGSLELHGKTVEYDSNCVMAAPIVTDLDEAWWGDEL